VVPCGYPEAEKRGHKPSINYYIVSESFPSGKVLEDIMSLFMPLTRQVTPA